MAWIFDVSFTTRPDYLMMNGVISMLFMLGTDRELLIISMYTFNVYWHVYKTATSTIDTYSNPDNPVRMGSHPPYYQYQPK